MFVHRYVPRLAACGHKHDSVCSVPRLAVCGHMRLGWPCVATSVHIKISMMGAAATAAFMNGPVRARRP